MLGRGRWRYQAEGTVQPVLVVVPVIDAEQALKMASADDQDPVEAIRAGAHPVDGA